MNLSIVLPTAALLPLLLLHEKNGNRRGVLPVKTALSLLFVIAATVQPHPEPRYTWFLLGGLVLCLGGDVCLVFDSPGAFMAGLILFLLGHVLYTFGFLHLAPSGRWVGIGIGAAVIAGAGTAIYGWLKPHLGSMRRPVLAYTLVISTMLLAAWAVFCGRNQPLSARLFVLAGALCFYLSDIFVARDRFIQKQFLNRLAGLPLYYGGQFLLAFSVGLVR